jgi:beta-xylosidase
MPDNVNVCPFSKIGCRNCPIYRGRHNYIVPRDGDEVPEARIVKKDDVDWQERFKEVLQNKEAPSHRHPNKKSPGPKKSGS